MPTKWLALVFVSWVIFMTKIKKIILLIIFIFAISSCFVACVHAQLLQEIRGVWVASVLNIDFPTKPGLDVATLKRELDDIVATVADAGLNAIFFQVRPTCDALYNSRIFPTSKWLVKQPGSALPDGFDPLAYLISIAKPRGIAIHAWINPLRVTNSAGKPLASQVAPNSPALQHPNWVVAFNGKHYLDAGLPEVRDFIANGVREIVQNYDVAGIAFDDYFYPPTGAKLQFNDDKTFATYGTGFTNRGDWRRDNINKMIRQCYETVKSVKSNCLFGVSPAGIWQNKKDHPLGSDTNGGNSYRNLCCDALAWMKGGYVDYISPQIYWQFTQKNARFDTLCRWWNANCDATGVPLVVSHAVYRVAQWQSAQEIANQVAFARQLRQYGGSIFYSYKDLKKNTLNIRNVIRKIMQQNSTRPVTFNNNFTIGHPRNNLTTRESGVVIMGQSNLDSPLFFADTPVSRTRNGFFCVYAPLVLGNNVLDFKQGSAVITRNVTRRNTVKNDEAVVSQKTHASVSLNSKISLPVEVVKNETRLRPTPNSSRHDDFLPAMCGTRDIALEESSTQYKLRMGGFVAKEDVKVIDEDVPISNLTNIAIDDTDGWTNICFSRDVDAPIDAKLEDNEFVITFFNTTSALTEILLPINPLFGSAKIFQDNSNVKLHFLLNDIKNFYGFTAKRKENNLQISLRNPSGLANGEKPLLGKTIILDAGHGGAESGANGPLEALNEEHLNLNFVMCLKDKLEFLGAKIILTREGDVDFKLLEREDFVKNQFPDLSISIHHNSLHPTPHTLENGGFLALYTNPAGKWLSETITDRVASDNFLRCSKAKFQRLAMCRFRAFPSVLLELGYLTCPEDVERASNEKDMDSICASIASAVLDFYKKQEIFISQTK